MFCTQEPFEQRNSVAAHANVVESGNGLAVFGGTATTLHCEMFVLQVLSEAHST